MNKKSLIFIFIIFIISFIVFSISVDASSLNIVKGNVKKSGELVTGVTYENYTATMTNDFGDSALQNISYVKKEAASGVKVVSWSILGSSGIVGGNIVATARDFELRNPGYQVIAGINGDYYDPPTKTPVNALVQNGDMIKSTNFTLDRYFSIGINDNGTGFITSKTNVLEPNYVLSIYAEDGMRVVKEVKLTGFNLNPNVNETSVYYKGLQEYEINNASAFEINLDTSIIYSTYFLRGNIIGEVSKTSTDLKKATIVSRDNEIIDLLKENPKVRIQKNLTDKNNGYDNVIGVGSQPMKDGVIKAFEDIGDQNVTFAKTRNPRSSIGWNDNGDLVIAAIDGRQANMAGADLREEAYVMQSLGCTNSFNFDGGGSTQLMIRENGQFVMLNHPSETYRSNANGILLVVPDVSINANFTNLTSSSVDVSYNYKLADGVTLKDIKIYVNEEERSISGNSFTLTNLDEYGINYISFVTTYEKDGVTYSRCFLSKRINISNTEVKPVPTKVKPSNFSVSFEKNETTNGFDAIINFDDPSNTIVKLYLINDGTKEIALKDTRGYVCKYKNITNTTSYDFQIEFYYVLNTITPVSEIYEETFLYQYDVVEDVSPEIPQEKQGCSIFNVVSTGFMFVSVLFVLLKRFRQI